MATAVSLRDRIEVVVDDLVTNNEMFTILDITQLVKADGGEWISHSTMRPQVEDVLRDRFSSQLAFAYYTESLIDVNTPVGQQMARLFHPIGEDPNNYTNRSQKASGPKPKTKVKVRGKVGPGHPTLTGRSVKKNRKQQAQGYVEVPRAVWKKARMKPNDIVTIEMHPDSITILRKMRGAKHYKKACKIATKSNVKSSYIPPSGRFRLSPSVLRQANLDGETLDFSAFTGKVVVSVKP